MARRNWKPSKSAMIAFKHQMEEIDQFCIDNHINASRTNDSYYFTLNGFNYRISNHSIESSNAKAYNWLGEKVRDLYHGNERQDNTIYIHASKTRIIEVFNNLKAGKKLDGRGNIIP